eukprot:m.11363 g.11363  ORF g.11363 m.11363 type:complete len:425 (+) comp23209_c0_seq1:302-1576(+)
MSSANCCQLSGLGLKGGLQGTHCEFLVEMPPRDKQKPDGSELSMNIKGPSKAVITSRPTDYGFKVDYFPTEPGDYTLTVLCDGEHVPGSPFGVKVLPNVNYKPVVDTTAGYLKCTAKGPGLKRGEIGKPCLFTVDVQSAGPGKLALSLTGPARTDLTKGSASTGYDYQFIPKVPGEYLLHITFSDHDIPGSPFTINVVDPVGASIANSSNSSSLQKQEARIRPGGATVQIGVGSGGDAAKCRAFGDGLSHSIALEATTFYVDCRGAGGGGKLYIRMTGPSKTELVEVERGYAFQYTTKAPGKYELVLLFNEEHVPGSPFTVNVAENPTHKGSYSFPEKVTVHGAGLRGGRSAVACTFYVDMSDAGAGTLSVEIQGPDEAPIELGKHDNGQTVVSYTPPVRGEYVISVRFSGTDVTGSPFKVFIQ